MGTWQRTARRYNQREEMSCEEGRAPFQCQTQGGNQQHTSGGRDHNLQGQQEQPVDLISLDFRTSLLLLRHKQTDLHPLILSPKCQGSRNSASQVAKIQLLERLLPPRVHMSRDLQGSWDSHRCSDPKQHPNCYPDPQVYFRVHFGRQCQ